MEVTLQDLGIGRLFQHVRDAIIVADAYTEEIVAWNQAASEILGYTSEEARAMPLHSLVPENLRTSHRTGIARYQKTGHGNLIDSGAPVELIAVHKDGHEVPIELTLTAMPDTFMDGHRFALAIIRDVTERKEAEEVALRLRDAQARQQQALELNDTIVQGLAVAKMALEVGQADKGLEAVTESLKRVKKLVAGLLSDIEQEQLVTEGALVRERPARVTGSSSENEAS
jgi:PAS domain S-box-containing protein